MQEIWSVERKIELLKLVLTEKQNGATWKEVAEMMGTTKDAVKNVYLRTDWVELLKENNLTEDDVISMSGEEYGLPEVDIEETAKKLISEKKISLTNNQELKKVKEHISFIAEKELITDKIIEAIKKVPDISPNQIKVPTPKTKLSPQESVLLISDSHIGLAVIEDEVGGLGQYNVQIFRKRLDGLITSVRNITELHRTNHPLDTIHVIFLGDIVHGSNDAGKWGFLHTEQTVVDQVFEACQQFTLALLTLRQFYKNVKVYGCSGNHGRVGQKGMEKLFVNWDYIIYKWIESSLSRQEGISFDFPKSPFHTIDVFGKRLLITHGDNIKSWLGIPFYGLNRMESRYKGLFERQKTVKKAWDSLENSNIDKENMAEVVKHVFNYQKTFDYLISAHFHTMGEVETLSGGKIILNSSFIGGDDYSINQLACSGTPSQKFFGINHDRKTWSYEIELDR